MILRTLAFCLGLVACSAVSGLALSALHSAASGSRISALSTAPEAEQPRFVIPSFAPSTPSAVAPVDRLVKNVMPAVATPERTPLPDLPTTISLPAKPAATAAQPAQRKSSFEAPRLMESVAPLVKSTRGGLDANVAPVIVSQGSTFQALPVPTRQPNYVIGVYR